MTTYTNTITDCRINDNTRFRDQMGWIGTQLENLGWAKQGDSGQIDFTSVTAPGAADTGQGYEIRKANDLYMKIYYGSGYAAYAKAIWLQFGTGSDGAGTLTGIKTQLRQIRTATGYSGGSVRAGHDYVCGGDSGKRLSIAMTDDTNSTWSGAVAIQRHVDAAGNYTDDNEWVLCRAQYNAYGDTYGWSTVGIDSQVQPVDSFATVRVTRAIGAAGSIPFLPIYTAHPTRNFAQFRDAYCVASSLVTYQATATIGGNTYLNVYGGNTTNTVWGFSSAINYSFLMRFD
jgi:hypothetical protein